MIAEKLVLFSARSAKKTSEKLKIVEISEVQNAMHIKNVLVCHIISLLLSHYAEIIGNPTLWQGGASFNLAELSEHDV